MNETNTTPAVHIVKLGICPKCGKGQMVKGSIGYSCNYFKSIEDKCTFNIYKEYFGKEITDDIALQIIENGETEVFNDFTKKDGTTFSASLRYEEGFVKPKFKNQPLEHECPSCGGKIEMLANGYACTNYHEKDNEENRRCSLYISKIIAGRSISTDEVEMLLKDKKTGFLDGFTNKKNETFSSRLVFNDSGGVIFDSKLCKCPKCGGDMYIGEKAYNCANFKNEKIKCTFSIWREISRREITPQEAIALCENKITPTLKGFKNKDGSFERKLTINEDFKVIMI
jgi:hypothetical protein